jgi:hypothetical protein
MRSARSKLGRFFLFIGLILLVVFFAMDQAKHPSYGFLCVGLVVVILGALLVVRGHQPPAESMRFRTLRRWRERQRQLKEDEKK